MTLFAPKWLVHSGGAPAAFQPFSWLLVSAAVWGCGPQEGEGTATPILESSLSLILGLDSRRTAPAGLPCENGLALVFKVLCLFSVTHS